MSSRLQVSLFPIICLTIQIVYPIHGTGISSKIDLDNDAETTPPATLSNAVLKAFVDINRGGAGHASKSSVTPSQQMSRGFREPGRRPANDHEVDDEANDYISIEDLFKKKKQQMHENPTGPSFAPSAQDFYGEPDAKPTIINNIHVTINANDSGLAVNGCKNGVCDVRVFSKPDDEGNVITNVHLSVVTKLRKSSIQITDIPVIEGTAGIRPPQFDQLPAFHFVDQSVRYGGSFFDNNIPQIPIHRQDVDSWYHQPPTMFERPRPVWHYGRNLDRGFKDSRASQGRRGWTETRSKEIVDDKIEPPLSKTNPSSQQN